ncbi:MAG: sigma-70 family RNA polymerase sigma factor [Sphingomonas sp.]|nr:MAG: sigma-70 family RNA polymerase sigma factor [Sphingomonas sp.]
MSASRIDLLTEAQRACLRLVLTHHNSKEIAALLGVSPSAIDKRIERAVQVLGASISPAVSCRCNSRAASNRDPRCERQDGGRDVANAVVGPAGRDV